jgi:hypothetical protein
MGKVDRTLDHSRRDGCSNRATNVIPMSLSGLSAVRVPKHWIIEGLAPEIGDS